MSNDSASTELTVESSAEAGSLMFAFGDPEPVLNRDLFDFLGFSGVFADPFQRFFIPPISLPGLAKSLDANPHHNSIIRFQRNMLAKWFIPSPLLSLTEFRKAALDFRVFGSAYFRIVRNRFGKPMRLERRPAIAMRVGLEEGVFFEMQNYLMGLNYMMGMHLTEYQPDEIVRIMEDDAKQMIYGIPEWFGGLQSVLLSEDLTLFRRRYFKNGAHMGYILVTTDAGLKEETAELIQNKLEEARGPGNFRNMYINIPKSSSREPVKVIPIGDIATKDDFDKVKNITKSEILAMHRMQPGIAGVIPENMTGFGDLEKVMRVYVELEVIPMQQSFLAINEMLPGLNPVSFKKPVFQ